MNHSMPVRKVECRSDCAGDSRCVLRRKFPFAIDPLAKRLSLDQRHHIEENSAGLARIVNRDNVRMSQARNCPYFLKKPLSAKCGGNVGVENLYGNVAVVTGIARAVNRGHSATAELVLYCITVPECFLGYRRSQFCGFETNGYSGLNRFKSTSDDGRRTTDDGRR